LSVSLSELVEFLFNYNLVLTVIIFQFVSCIMTSTLLVVQNNVSFCLLLNDNSRKLFVINLQHFEVDTEDLAGIQFAPDSRVLCVWESCLQVNDD
jgi:hypothetical protein